MVQRLKTTFELVEVHAIQHNSVWCEVRILASKMCVLFRSLVLIDKRSE